MKSFLLPHHYRHDQRGVEVLQQWNRRTTLPRNWIKAATLVIEEHMRAAVLTHPGKIVDLLMKIHSSILPVKNFNDIIKNISFKEIITVQKAGTPDEKIFYGQDAVNNISEYMSVILIWR